MAEQTISKVRTKNSFIQAISFLVGLVVGAVIMKFAPAMSWYVYALAGFIIALAGFYIDHDIMGPAIVGVGAVMLADSVNPVILAKVG